MTMSDVHRFSCLQSAKYGFNHFWKVLFKPISKLQIRCCRLYKLHQKCKTTRAIYLKLQWKEPLNSLLFVPVQKEIYAGVIRSRAFVKTPTREAAWRCSSVPKASLCSTLLMPSRSSAKTPGGKSIAVMRVVRSCSTSDRA
mmetsp:Transcript_36864/g.49383  ORF Transcript_36864/g.49383 Transcript_36864/m.49383 type:complete len:141 (-) Transcript_36864:551-973(-)